MNRLFTIISIFFLVFQVRATETEVYANFSKNSCSYFSNVSADITLYLADSQLASSSQVNLIYGLGDSIENRDWEKRKVVPTSSVGLSNVRVANVTVRLAERSYPLRYDKLQFVWEVRPVGAPVEYINGGSSWGSFEVKFPSLSEIECSSMGDIPKSGQKLRVEIIKRN